jgi:opacity protein-like surface antigen
MRFFKQHLISLAMITALAAPVVMAGCAARVETGYRVYDPGYHEYHVWDSNEGVYYQHWETDTHRHHKDFRKRSKNEQQQYWDWRHNQH